MIGWDGLAWYVWMPAAPATLLLSRRFPVSRKNARRSIAGLTVGSFAIYAVIANSRYLLRMTPNLWLPDSFDLPMDWERELRLGRAAFLLLVVVVGKESVPWISNDRELVVVVERGGR